MTAESKKALAEFYKAKCEQLRKELRKTKASWWQRRAFDALCGKVVDELMTAYEKDQLSSDFETKFKELVFVRWEDEQKGATLLLFSGLHWNTWMTTAGTLMGAAAVVIALLQLSQDHPFKISSWFDWWPFSKPDTTVVVTDTLKTGPPPSFPDINFATGSSAIREAERDNLKTIHGLLKNHAGLRVVVLGYTDSSGDEETNVNLSFDRAEAVVQELIQQGIPSDRLHTEGCNDTNPVGDNRTEKGKAKNRRVEVKMVQQDEVAPRNYCEMRVTKVASIP